MGEIMRLLRERGPEETRKIILKNLEGLPRFSKTHFQIARSLEKAVVLIERLKKIDADLEKWKKQNTWD